jgi:hypothetical protein
MMKPKRPRNKLDPANQNKPYEPADKIRYKRLREQRNAKKIREFVRYLNRSPLGCKVFYDVKKQKHTTGDRILAADSNRGTSKTTTTSITGVAKGGVAIFIQVEDVGPRGVPVLPRKETRLFMQAMEKTGAIVGVAYDYEDAFEIVNLEKRKQRTFSYHLEGNNDYGKTKKKLDRYRGDIKGKWTDPNEAEND